ncbi:MAG: two-component regulator propeller domain-containing protein, partial [Bacteroidia bacterium]
FFYTWFKQNGISRDELRFIYKDKRDHLWIGGSGVDEIIPSEGIIKHYGKQQIGQGLISIKEDAKGRLLFGLVEGLQIFDPATDTLTYLGLESGITKAVVNTLIVDSKQRIWLALNGGGVNVIDPSINKIYYIDDKRGLSNNDIRDIMQDKNGNIWMGGWNGGVDYYDPESGKFYQLREKNGLCDRYIRCFNEDENGNIWIGCLSGGLDLYDPVKRKISHIYGKRGIVRSDCRSIFRDSFNRMWVSTNGSGILLYNATIGTKDNFNTKWRSAKTAVNTVLEDAEGNFWIGTGGLGMDLVNIKEKTLKHLMNEDWTDGWINRLYDDSIGNIWMTTDYRLDKLNKATSVVTSWGKDEGLPNEMVRSMSVCKNDIYLGTIGGLEKFIKGTETFTHLECKDYPLKNLISFMEFDKKGHLWMASYSDGVFELDTATLQLKHYGKQQGLNKVFIYSMTIDKTGNIWLGTGGDGLKIIDPVTKNITTLTVADGLCEMTVLSLHENNGRIYAGTVKGLSVIEAKGGHFEIDNYDKPQGFEATDFNQNSVMQATDGRIWWGIGEVLTIFKPTEKKSAQGKTFITSIHVKEKELVTRNDHYLQALTTKDTIWSQTRDTFYFKETLPPDTGYFKTNNIKWAGIEGSYNLPKQLTLPYNQDHLTFNFSSNFLSNTNRTTYRYILEGADHSWSNPTLQAYVDYRNLSPGDYTFKVCSNNFNGPYTPVASFSFTILPPWWKTYPAYFIYALCFIGLIVGYNKLRTRQLLKRQRELEQNVKERTAQIEKQKDEIESQKLLVEEKQKEIVDSINYARRIQYTLLAHEELLRKHLRDFFILFQPKDIVSGDFYWSTAVTIMQQAESSSQSPNADRQLFYLAVCDSTGHGVPGAFMSLLNISFLNEAINEKKIYSPDKILDYVRGRLIDNLSQEGGRDGMDGVLLCFDSANNR